MSGGAGRGRRRLWFTVVVAVWVAVLVAAGLWSVRDDPPTVAEQRDIGQAVPQLRHATGAVVAAAEDDRWALRVGELRIQNCSITPVRPGRVASQELTVVVPEGDARAALDGIAAGLRAGYRPSVMATRGGTRLSLYADAGQFTAITAEALSTDQILTVRVDSGCRPATGAADVSDPPAPSPPAALAATLTALGAAPVPGPQARVVTCPDGGTAATFVAAAGAVDAADGPVGVPDGTLPVWADAGGWAYRIGPESVVVSTSGGQAQVAVTTGCRAD